MQLIEKARETMSARERVRRTFAFETTDRVTIGYDTNAVVLQKLYRALGVAGDDYPTLCQILGVDYLGVWPNYTGPKIYPDIPGRVRSPDIGAVMRLVANQFGSYYDFCDFPLRDADPEAIDAYPFPDPDDYDYEEADRRMAWLEDRGFAIHIGNAGVADILNSTGMLMGTEDALVNIYTEDEATMRLIDRRIDGQLAVLERLLARSRDRIDFLWMGEDLGSQKAPLISMDTYQQLLRPRHQRFVDLAKAYGLPVLFHSCGSSSWVFETLIEMGVNGVDTLQPEANRMSPGYLAEHFGGRLNFRGCISTAGPLAYGSAEDTDRVCRETLETLMPFRGYHFAPTHAIQDNTPVANIVAMYQAAHRYGCYS